MKTACFCWTVNWNKNNFTTFPGPREKKIIQSFILLAIFYVRQHILEF